MGASPRYALPYPELSDPADAHAAIGNLANAVDPLLLPATVVTGAGAVVLGSKLVASDPQRAFSINGAGLIAWGAGGSVAQDTNLYRFRSLGLKTDADFVGLSLTALGEPDATSNEGGIWAQRNVAGKIAFASWVSVPQDANDRFEIFADGRLRWGDGTNALDTTLYRASPQNLATDGSFYAGKSLIVDNANGGNRILFGSALDTSLYRWAQGWLALGYGAGGGPGGGVGGLVLPSGTPGFAIELGQTGSTPGPPTQAAARLYCTFDGQNSLYVVFTNGVRVKLAGA